MNINLNNNWHLKTTLLFLVLSFVILTVFSDFVLDFAINNTMIWYYVGTYRWFFILFSMSLLLYFLLKKPYSEFNKLKEELTTSKKNYRLVVDNLKDDYFFYRHEKNAAFKYLSSSVTNVLGYSKIDFIENYKNIGAIKLFDKCFERHKQLSFNDIKQPPFEIEVKNNNGSFSYLEIREIPLFDTNNELIAIEGIARNITRYKISEKELTEKENKYHTLFETANDAYFIIKDDKFIDCNGKATEIFKCTLEELIMHTPYHYKFSPANQPNGQNSREFARTKINKALEGIPQFFEWKHLRNGEEEFDAEVTLNCFNFNNEKYLLAIVRDITERKFIENQILEKEKNYHLIFDNSPFGMFYFNFNGIISDCNEKYQQILDISRNEIIGYNFLNTKYNKEFIQAIKTCLSGIKNSYTGVYYINKNKSLNLNVILTPVFDNENKISGGFCIVIDISDYTSLAEKGIKNEINFKEILENARQILYKLNTVTGNYEYISSAIYKILGYTTEEFYSFKADDIKALLHPDDIEKADNIVAKLVKSLPKEKSEYTVEYRIKHKNGNYVWVSDKYKIISDSNNEINYIIGNVMDISQLKEANESLSHFIKQNTNKN